MMTTKKNIKFWTPSGSGPRFYNMSKDWDHLGRRYHIGKDIGRHGGAKIYNIGKDDPDRLSIYPSFFVGTITN